MDKAPQTYVELIPDHANIKERPEYQRLVRWCATPTPLRIPDTQGKLAVELQLDETTLSRWKRMPEFYGDVRLEIKRTMRDEVPDVLYALRNRIFQKGSKGEVKLFLEWVDEFIPTTKLITDSLNPTDPSVVQLVQAFQQQLFKHLTKRPAPPLPVATPAIADAAQPKPTAPADGKPAGERIDTRVADPVPGQERKG